VAELIGMGKGKMMICWFAGRWW